MRRRTGNLRFLDLQRILRTLLLQVEVILVAAAFCGPIVGGVATARTGRSKWLMIGILVAAACVVVATLLAKGQESTLD